MRKLLIDTGGEKVGALFGNLILIVLRIKKFCCFRVNILMDYGHDPWGVYAISAWKVLFPFSFPPSQCEKKALSISNEESGKTVF